MQQEVEENPSAGEAEAATASEEIHPVTLYFYALRANEQVQVRLEQNTPAYWGDTFAGNRRVGVVLSASPPGVFLQVNRFVLNKKSFLLSNNADCAEIRVRLYVHHPGTRIVGVVDLPPGARLEMESLVDRAVNVRGSFSLNLC